MFVMFECFNYYNAGLEIYVFYNWPGERSRIRAMSIATLPFPIIAKFFIFFKFWEIDSWDG